VEVPEDDQPRGLCVDESGDERRRREMSTGQREGIKEGDWETPWDHVHLQRDPETGEYAEIEFCGRGEKCRRGEDPTEEEEEEEEG
jgi:hypothetical protein